MKTHATGRPSWNAWGWWLCCPKRFGTTSTTYANCGNCLRILKAREKR